MPNFSEIGVMKWPVKVRILGTIILKKEIENLECRIVADKKRLLKPFMKKERTEAVQYVDDKAPRNNDEMK